MHFSKRNAMVMAIGIIIMGLGIAIFKLSLMGNDPTSAMNIAIADYLHVDFAYTVIVFNAMCFLVEFIWGRKMIGIGTFVNWFGIGSIASFFSRMLAGFLPANMTYGFRIIMLLVGILVLSLSLSMYQTANVGIAPSDSVSIILSQKLPVPYFVCRVSIDCICAVVTYIFGGILGLGTLVCAFGLGPFVQFFNKTVSEKLCEQTDVSL